MAHNKKLYTEAMRKGHNLAWEGHFTEAIFEYRSALAEFPDDVAANSSLGAACLRLNRLPEALAAYQAVQKKAPKDIASLSKVAEIQGRLGKREEAGASFQAVAQAYSQQGLAAKSLEAYQQLVALLPDYLPGHLCLAEAFVAAGQGKDASRAYFTAAQLYQKQDQFADAVAALEQAILHHSENQEAMALLQSLRGEAPAGAEAAKETPVQVAAREAQARLAQAVFAEPAAEAAPSTEKQRRLETLLGKALEYQAQGLVPEAIACYEQLLKEGVRRPEVDYSLGLMYQQAGLYDQAISVFTRMAQVPGYAVGSNFAIGQIYRSQGELDKAMEYFLQAANVVDLETMRREQADDLIELYRRLAEGYKARGQEDKALALVTSLADALSTKGWEDKASSVRAEVSPQGAVQGAVVKEEPASAPQAEMPEWQAVSQKLAAADAYMERQQYLAALEECHDIISLAPGYLPVHHRLGAIYTGQGRTPDALRKYLTLAALHTVRNEPDQALEAYRLAARAAPDEPEPHSRLAQIYLGLGEREKALAELDILGDLQLGRGQKEQALATIHQIIALAPPDVEGYQRLLTELTR